MRNTPISSTLPKRFFVARRMRWSSVLSPSKYSTVSTMCSSVFGPAMPPPFVTCPTTNTAVPLSFAKRIRRAAHSRTWPTLPGAPSRSRGEDRLDRIDDQHAGRARRRRREDRLEMRLAEQRDIARALAEAIGAQLHLQRRLLARDVERRVPGCSRAAPRPAAAASTCRCRARRRRAPSSRERCRRRARSRTRRGRCDRRLSRRRRRRAATVAGSARAYTRHRRALVARARSPPATLRRAISSTSVFHSPQVSQRPAHLA